jgi:hypothetical protein
VRAGMSSLTSFYKFVPNTFIWPSTLKAGSVCFVCVCVSVWVCGVCACVRACMCFCASVCV